MSETQKHKTKVRQALSEATNALADILKHYSSDMDTLEFEEYKIKRDDASDLLLRFSAELKKLEKLETAEKDLEKAISFLLCIPPTQEEFFDGVTAVQDARQEVLNLTYLT